MANNNYSLLRETYILENEKDPDRSKKRTVYPKSTLDQIFDPSDNNKTLRQILTQMSDDIRNVGIGEIKFPVVSVNGKRCETDDGNIELDKVDIGLGNVSNVPDEAKELSPVQEAQVDAKLEALGVQSGAETLLTHLQDLRNPHHVTLDQINAGGAVTNLVDDAITQHKNDDSAHPMIVSQFANLRSDVEASLSSNTEEIEEVANHIEEHSSDPNAHVLLFQEKEDIQNKTDRIDGGDSTHYPTTTAVVDYVEGVLNEFNSSLEIPGEWIADVRVLSSISELPTPSAEFERILYIVKNGSNGFQSIYICRRGTSGYYWDSSELGSPSRFNSDHFVHRAGEMSLNISALGEILLNEHNIAERVDELVSDKLPAATSEFPTREEVGHVIHKITILPGTIDGHIRFYENDDPSTMSDDIKVAGLQRLAYMENVSNNEILPESIDENQIKPRAIQNRHLDDKIITVRNFRVPYNTLVGNVSDSTGDSAQNVTLQQLASALAPFFEVHGDSIRAANIDY